MYALNQVRRLGRRLESLRYAQNSLQKMLDELSHGSQDAPPPPLVGEVTSMRELRAEYERGSPSFVQQIDWLVSRGYNRIRRTRGRHYPIVDRSGVDHLRRWGLFLQM